MSFFVTHNSYLPGSFQAEFCISHSLPLSKQVELVNNILHLFMIIIFQEGAFHCFNSYGFEKEPLTIAKTRLAFIGCYRQLDCDQKECEPKFWEILVPKIWLAFQLISELESLVVVWLLLVI